MHLLGLGLGLETQRSLDGLLELVLIRHFLSLTMSPPEATWTSVSARTTVASATVSAGTTVASATAVWASAAHHHPEEPPHWTTRSSVGATMTMTTVASAMTLPAFEAHVIEPLLLSLKNLHHLRSILWIQSSLLADLGELLRMDHLPE